MFKTNEEIIVIQAKATTPIPTGVVFWSHDKGTAKMIFQLQKDYVNQTLSEGTIVPICLDFVGGRHIYHAVIEDAINGIVSIVLEDNILGYVGRVTGSIYIELPDSRSLDTAGRFTFDIKRSPIDLNTPELEDYYWQGFNEIIDEYHQTINTIESEAKALIDSLTADVTTAQSKITQLEQSITTANTNLNAHIDEINKKIDDNDVFTKAESSANVIYQLIGKEIVEWTITIDTRDKVKGSVLENPNILATGAYSDVMKPSDYLTEMVQQGYNQAAKLDNNILQWQVNVNGNRSAICDKWNVLEVLVRTLGDDFFNDRGAHEISDKIEVIKNILTEIKPATWGYGTSPTGNKLSYKVWVNNNSWGGTRVNGGSTLAKLEYSSTGTAANNYISDDGFLYAISYAEPSDGVTPSTVNTDYSNLEIKIRLSMNEHLKLMIAANRVENLATQEEAETGEDNKKIMTPLRVMQSIKKFVENKFVSIAGNETIGGLKNFRDGLMVNGNNVLTHKGVVTIKYSNADFPTEIASGYITFVRYGDEVQAVFNFKTRIGNDFAKDQSIIWGIAADFQADTSEPQYIGITSTGGTTSIVKFTEGGSTLTAHSILLKDTWYAGTVTYLAKNKL